MIRRMKIKKVGDGYEVKKDFTYYSKRYNRNLTISKGFYSDGATMALDIDSDAWIVHDHICRYGRWNDGSKIDNWSASTVLSDILSDEAKSLINNGKKFQGYIREIRSYYWWLATFLFGGGAARKNGLFRVKKWET